LLDLCSTGRSLDLLTSLSATLLYDIGDLLFGRIDPSRAILPVAARKGLSLLPGAFRTERPPTLPELVRTIRLAEESVHAEYTVFDARLDTLALRTATVSDKILLVSDTTPVSLRAAAEAALTLPTDVEARLLINRFPVYPAIKTKIPSVKPWIDEIRLPLFGILPDSLTLAAREAEGDGVSFPSENLSIAYANLAARIEGAHAPLCRGWKKIKRRRLQKQLIG
jgi:septum formation inhibitor-activating ATPase MinD